MCGRFALDAKTDELIQEFVAAGGDYRDWTPGWNIAPTDTVPVIRERHGERELAGVRWGIVSSSAPTFGDGKPIINARIETVATNGLFKRGFAAHRCIGPANGYYEWELQEHGKQPYFVHEPDRRMAMAGIINAWRDRTKPEEDPQAWRLSMAIITRDAHVAPGDVHDRMPACLKPDTFDDWLGDHLGTEELLRLLDQTSLEVAHDLTYYPVSKTVNTSGKNKADGPSLIEPVTLPPQNTRPEALF